MRGKRPYYSHRRGWHFLQNFGTLASAAGRPLTNWSSAASCLVFTRNTFWWLERYLAFREYLDARYRRVRETEAYLIFDIRWVRSE